MLARPSAAASAKRAQVSKPQARQSHARPFGPSPIWSRMAATASGSGTSRRGLKANTAPTLATTPASTTGCRLRGASVAAISSRRQNSSSVGPESGWSIAPSLLRMSTKPRSSRSTATARATAGSASSPRILRNRRLE